MLRKIEGRGRIGLSEDEMAGSYHQCNGHELGQTSAAHDWATEQQNQ